MTKVTLIQARNPVAARLIKRYQITQQKLNDARNGSKWTKAQYQEYLQTDHWRTMRAKALLHYGRKCYLCGAAGDGVQIDIHHNDYSRLGGEWMSDLIPLCNEHHEMYHQHETGI